MEENEMEEADKKMTAEELDDILMAAEEALDEFDFNKLNFDYESDNDTCYLEDMLSGRSDLHVND